MKALGLALLRSSPSLSLLSTCISTLRGFPAAARRVASSVACRNLTDSWPAPATKKSRSVYPLKGGVGLPSCLVDSFLLGAQTHTKHIQDSKSTGKTPWPWQLVGIPLNDEVAHISHN